MNIPKRILETIKNSTDNNPQNNKQDEEKDGRNHNETPKSSGWGMEDIKWEDLTSNNISLQNKLNQDIYNAYNLPNNPNEILIFKNIAEILSQTSSSSKNMLPFVHGNSRDYDSYIKNGQYVFNMFIDFAYSGSFNYFDIPLKCLTLRASKFFRNYTVVDNSYRALSFAIVLQNNFKNLSEEEFWGDSKSIKYLLHKDKRKSYNIFDSLKIQESKMHFGKTFEQKKPILDIFEDGNYGMASRFNILIHKFSEILYPQISVNSISYNDDTKLKYWIDEQLSINDQPSYLKSKEGNLKVGLSVKGCIKGYEIWTESGLKLDPVYSEYISETHSYIVDLLLPLDLMENPFDPENKYKEEQETPLSNIMVPDKPNNNSGSNIPLNIKMDLTTINLQAIKLNLQCIDKDMNLSKINKFYPQSHVAKAMLDPGYFGINLNSGRIEIKDANNIFQITIQDISKLEQKQLIRQTSFSNIEIITDFDLFFNTNDAESLYDILTFRTEDDTTIFEVGDIETQINSSPKGVLKFLSYDEKKKRIIFHKNLKQIVSFWDVEFTSFADIGCCTTNTLGETTMRITNYKRDNNIDEIFVKEKINNLHKMEFGKLFIYFFFN